MDATENTAVLLLAHGSPDSVEDIPCFLHAVTGGRSLPEAIVKEVQHRYSLIGRSPLREITTKQALSLQRELGLPVYVGMRNWEPYIRDVVPHMAADGITRAVVICLAPQNSRTSVGLYQKALLGTSGEIPFAVDFIENWHDAPLLIEAFANKFSAAWSRACAEQGHPVPVIFTAHSVPTRTIVEGDPYETQARETAQLVAERAFVGSATISGDSRNLFQADAQPSTPDIRFAFQSQGMSGGNWLGPTVESTMEALHGEGHRAVFLQPIGFLCDHVEVLYDIDIAFRQFAEARGMKLYRADSLNDSPQLTAALASIVRSRLQPRTSLQEQTSAT